MTRQTLTQLLGEKDGTVLVADLDDFARVSAGRDPAEIGLFLTTFYLHLGAAVEAEGGRVVKFLGDGALAVFLQRGHRAQALRAMAALERARGPWQEESARAGLPPLDYSVGIASGELLEGEVGTDRVVFYDVLGPPVNAAFRLCALAASRGVHDLVDQDTAQGAGVAGPATVEVEGAELSGVRHRLFRVDLG